MSFIQHVDTALLLFLFGGLIGAYTYIHKISNESNTRIVELGNEMTKRYGEIMKVVSEHKDKAGIHESVDISGKVDRAVCEQVQEKNELHFTTLQNGQEDIKQGLNKLFDKLSS